MGRVKAVYERRKMHSGSGFQLDERWRCNGRTSLTASGVVVCDDDETRKPIVILLYASIVHIVNRDAFSGLLSSLVLPP